MSALVISVDCVLATHLWKNRRPHDLPTPNLIWRHFEQSCCLYAPPSRMSMWCCNISLRRPKFHWFTLAAPFFLHLAPSAADRLALSSFVLISLNKNVQFAQQVGSGGGGGGASACPPVALCNCQGLTVFFLALLFFLWLAWREWALFLLPLLLQVRHDLYPRPPRLPPHLPHFGMTIGVDLSQCQWHSVWYLVNFDYKLEYTKLQPGRFWYADCGDHKTEQRGLDLVKSRGNVCSRLNVLFSNVAMKLDGKYFFTKLKFVRWSFRLSAVTTDFWVQIRGVWGNLHINTREISNAWMRAKVDVLLENFRYCWDEDDFAHRLKVTSHVHNTYN